MSFVVISMRTPQLIRNLLVTWSVKSSITWWASSTNS